MARVARWLSAISGICIAAWALPAGCWFELGDVKTQATPDSSAGAGGSGSTAGAGGWPAGGGVSGSAGAGSAGGIGGAGGTSGAGGSGGQAPDAGGCQAGHLDCNQNPSDGCEVYSVGDPENCGACGRNCQTLPCKWGFCEEQVLAQEAGLLDILALDQDRVYFARQSSATEYEIKRVDKTGQNGATIAAAGKKPTGIATSNATSYVYWTSREANAVYRAPKSGGIAQPIMGSGTSSTVDQPAAIIVDGTEVFVVEEAGATRLLRYTEGLAAVASLGVIGCGWVENGIAIDVARVYVACPGGSSGGVYVGSIKAALRTGGSVTTLAANVKQPHAVAVDTSYVYYSVKASDDAVVRVPIAGGAAQPIVKHNDGAWALAIDAQSLYWADSFSIHKAAKTGDPSANLGKGGVANGAQFLADDKFLYYVGFSSGMLTRLPK